MNANRFEKNDVDSGLATLQVAQCQVVRLSEMQKIFGKFLFLLLGIVLAAERRNTNKLLDEVFHSEKIYKLNEDMVRNC